MLLLSYIIHYFFFFQAEDGIRDWSVTGVQTCALPIFGPLPGRAHRGLARLRGGGDHGGNAAHAGRGAGPGLAHLVRSEERRVGKECRSWWSGEHEKKKRR